MLAVAFVMVISGVDAAIYKWVDEKGVTQYSEKPPAGKKPEQVPIPTQNAPSPSQAPQSTSGAKTWQEKEAEFQQRRVEQEMARKEREANEQAGAAERLRRCIQARQNLHGLEQKSPVYRINEKGEQVYIGDKDREQLRERMREVVEQNCDRK